MPNYRIKTKVNGDENVYPEKFKSKTAAEDFLKNKVPAPFIPELLAQGIIKIYQESSLVDRSGKPIELEIVNEESA